jgi:hypothetical protein
MMISSDEASPTRTDGHPAMEHIEREVIVAAHHGADLPLEDRHFLGAVHSEDAEVSCL